MGFLDWVRGVNEKLEPQGATTTPPVPTENAVTARPAPPVHGSNVITSPMAEMFGTDVRYIGSTLM